MHAQDQSRRSSDSRQHAAWLAAVAAGDRAAFDSLYRAYRDRLAAYIYRLIGDADLVPEVMNDVMFAIWRSAASYRARSSPSTWIFGVARHRALNAVRRRRPEVQLEASEAAPDRTREPAASGPDPEARADRALLRNHLLEALGALSAEHREVLQLTFFQGRSQAEIAEIAGCPVNTVKTRVYHAKRQLQPILRRMGYAGEGP